MPAASTPVLIERREHGWRMGFANLLGNELWGWWGTRLGWLLAGGSPVLVTGVLAILLFTLPAGVEPLDGVQGLLKLIGLVAPLAIIVLMQDSIIRERQTGTCAWILSKPASRSAFIFAKLVSYSLNGIVVLVLLPGLTGYALLVGPGGQAIAAAGFMGALGLLALNTLFYVGLMLMLGTLFQQRGPVLAVALGITLGLPMLLNLAPALAWFTPVPLADLATLVAHGAGPVNRLPVAPLATAGWSVGFVLAALWRFRRLEL